MNRGAIRCLLSQKVRETKLTLLSDFNFDDIPTTKQMASVLGNLALETSTLIVTMNTEEKVVLSARNIPKVKTLPAQQINVVDLLNHDRILMTMDAVRKAEAMWASKENTSEDGN